MAERSKALRSGYTTGLTGKSQSGSPGVGSNPTPDTHVLPFYNTALAKPLVRGRSEFTH